MQTFLAPHIDIVFKKLFGSEDHKRVTVSFLNSILEYTGDRCIQDIQFMNNEQLPMGLEKKENILDIFCIDRAKRQYIVEIQNAWMKAFGKRVLFYGAKAYANQLSEAKPYHELDPVVVIAITKKFKVFPKKKAYKSIHYLTDSKTHEHDLKDLTFAFVELPKFTKQEHELVTDEDKWLFLLANIGNYDHVPDPLKQAEFSQACQALHRMTWSDSEYAVYEKGLLNAQAEEASAYLAMNAEEHAQKARVAGKQEGREEERYDLARKMLAKGLDIETIISITGLRIEQIEALRKR